MNMNRLLCQFALAVVLYAILAGIMLAAFIYAANTAPTLQ